MKTIAIALQKGGTGKTTTTATLSHALARLPDGFPKVRAINPAALATPEAADAFLEAELASAGIVVARLLGGKRAFDAGWERLVRECGDLPVWVVDVDTAYAGRGFDLEEYLAEIAPRGGA